MKHLSLFLMLGFLFVEESFSAQKTYYEKHHPKPVNEAVVGIVEKTFGPCYVRRGGTSRPREVVLGLRLFENDALLTEKGRLHVRYKDGTFVELSEDSSFQVERVRYTEAQRDESVFRFLGGIARVVSKNIPEEPTKNLNHLKHYTVKTANTMVKAYANSDFYIIQHADTRDFTIGVIKGKVLLMSSVTNEFTEVAAGTGAYLKTSGAVVKTDKFEIGQIPDLRRRTRL